MTAAAYSSTKPLQAKRVWHADVIDRLLLLWPVTAIVTGMLLSVFGLALGAAITFGLLAGCAIALVWTFVTVPYARLRDGLTTYKIARTDGPLPRGARYDAPVLISRETIFWIASAGR